MNYKKKRYVLDLKYQLSEKFGKAVRQSLKKAAVGKTNHWETIVGYTVRDLIDRLSATLPIGCSWGDYQSGNLHIDHIRPLCSFKFTKETDPEFCAAWELQNLQLLTAADNLKKGATWKATNARE